MSLTANIYNAFATQVSLFAASNDLPVAYPGINFDPPDEGAWLEVRVFWNDNINYGLANSGPTIEQGFFRVIVCYRPGLGLIPAQELAEAVVNAFPKGTHFGKARTERAPTMGGPIQHDDKEIIPVTIRWRATRTT